MHDSDSLIQRFIEGNLTDVEAEKLDELLSSDPEIGNRLLGQFELDAMLRASKTQTESSLTEGYTERVAVENTGQSTDNTQRIESYNRPPIAFAGWIVAALVLVACSIWSYTLLDSQTTTIVKDVQTDELVETSDAVVTSQIDAEFAEGVERIETGQSLDGKWVRLASGIIQVEFASGAQLALQGPAELRVDSDMECFLKSGKLTVLAPPEASLFTVKSPTGNVIDLGTEFGVVVDADGQMDVHVLDGEVEVEVGDQPKRRLVEDQAATIDPETMQINDTAIDRESFEPIRHATLLASKPLKLQFDCGIRAGVYHGTESPAHAAGDVASTEIYWNGLIGDQTGRFVLADGAVSPMALEVDYGQYQLGSESKRAFSWDAEPETIQMGHCLTRGVFDTALGKDRLSSGGTLGLRIRGLPVGRYRVYFIARGVDDGRKGNLLVEKGYRVAVGADLSRIPKGDGPTIMPLDDPDARQWVAGQTHHVGEVELVATDEYLTLLVRRDPDLSPQRGGGGTPIVGVQIVQIDE